MQRYFLKNEQFNGQHVTILEEDAHHIGRVMRQKVGDSILVCNELGQCFLVRLLEVSTHVYAEIIEEIATHAELPISITIAQGLVKGDKFEWVIQKGTECGAVGFMPVAMSRSVVKLDSKKEKKKTERWQKIAKEAAEQSHRAVLPHVHDVVTFREVLTLADRYDVCLFAYEESAKKQEFGQLRQTLERVKPGDKVLMIVGPEGGISEQEVESLLAANFKACALGPRILRTETAPLYFLNAVSYALEC